MNTVTFITRSTALAASVAVFSLSACLESTNTNTPGSSNRFGYGGTSTSPSGVNQQPTAGADGTLGQALAGQPSTGTQTTQNVNNPAAGTTGTVGAPILPKVDPNATSTNKIDPKKPADPPNAGTAGAGGVNPTAGSTKPPKKTDYPFGIPVPGREGLVYSPYDKEAGYVDVRGLDPGSLVEDPYSKKYFRVP